MNIVASVIVVRQIGTQPSHKTNGRIQPMENWLEILRKAPTTIVLWLKGKRSHAYEYPGWTRRNGGIN